MLVGTKLQHVVSSLALEIVEQYGPSVETQLKPRDDLFWFGKPEILLRLIQFIIFQVSTRLAYDICYLFRDSISYSVLLLSYAECLRDGDIYLVLGKTTTFYFV